jgi:hypothetical protein
VVIDTKKKLMEAAARRKQKHAEADAEYDAVVQALKTLGCSPRELDRGDDDSNEVQIAPTEQAETNVDSDPLPAASDGLTPLLRWAMRRFTGEEFTTPGLARVLEDHGIDLSEKKAFAASAMTKMADRGEIIKVRPGSGRSPTVFRRRRPSDPVGRRNS